MNIFYVISPSNVFSIPDYIFTTFSTDTPYTLIRSDHFNLPLLSSLTSDVNLFVILYDGGCGYTRSQIHYLIKPFPHIHFRSFITIDHSTCTSFSLFLGRAIK